MLMLSLALALVLFVSSCAAQPAECGTLLCSAYTTSCDSGRCQCRPEFFGPTCLNSFPVAKPDLFYGLHGHQAALMFLCSVFGVFLVLYYFCRFIPKAKQQSQQILSITMVTGAALCRFIASTMYLSYGPSALATFFYQKPNVTQFFLRLFVAVLYPLCAGTLTLQVLIWMEFVMAVRSLKPASQTWVPRLKWVFFPALTVLLLFVTLVTLLLTFNVNTSIVLVIYRVFLIAYLGVLLVLALIFAVRLFRILAESGKFMPATKLSVRARNSRRNLTRMVLVSCFFVLVGLILAILYVALPVDSDPNYYWPFLYLLRLTEAALIMSLLLTALAMMRNRIAYSQNSTVHVDPTTGQSEVRDSHTDHSTSTTNYASTSDEGVPLMGRNLKRGTTVRSSRKPTNKELQQPLMDYSGFGSVVEDDSEAEFSTERSSTMRASQLVHLPNAASLLDNDSHIEQFDYEVGELVWAQYRMDGLWYAGRVVAIYEGDVELEYLDYDLVDTLPLSCVCPDYKALLTGERLNPIKAFDSCPSKTALVEPVPEPDTFGLVRLRGKVSRKPNHSSLLLKRGSVSLGKK